MTMSVRTDVDGFTETLGDFEGFPSRLRAVENAIAGGLKELTG